MSGRNIKWGDLASLEYGKGLQDYLRDDGKYPVFGTNGKIGTTNSCLCPYPSIIIGRKGAYRGVHFSSTPFYVIDTAFYLKPKVNNLDMTFAYYHLLTVDINYMDSGSAIPSTSREDFYDLDILLPSLPEQKSIASILSSLDDKIDLLHRQNKTIEALAETLFRQWFVEDAEEGWETGKLGDVISVRGGTTPSTKVAAYWDGDVYWTTPRDLSSRTSIFLTTTERKITEKGLAQIGSGLLPDGTVLLSSRAPIVYLAITEIPVAINQGYIAIVCDKIVSNYFIYLWIKKNLETIINAANGSTFLEISKSTFKNLDFQIPPRTKLDDFDAKAEPLFAKIKSNVHQIRTLTRLRDTLLPKLMSGEVRVKETENITKSAL